MRATPPSSRNLVGVSTSNNWIQQKTNKPDVSRKGAKPEGSKICDSPLEVAGTAVIVGEQKDDEGYADTGNTGDEDVVGDAPEWG